LTSEELKGLKKEPAEHSERTIFIKNSAKNLIISTGSLLFDNTLNQIVKVTKLGQGEDKSQATPLTLSAQSEKTKDVIEYT
jgi:hypothetical protein